MSHVRLTMIARNEADNIQKLADAVKHQIDSWLVTLDPRTTDNSERLFYEAFEGVPGRVVMSKLGDEDFRFDAARNEALELAREPGVHLLLLDVDSPIAGTLPKELDQPLYWCPTVQGGSDWIMPFLIRSDVKAKYVFPAHEVLIIEDDLGEPVILQDVFVMRTGAGTNPERIAWTIKVLTEEWEATQDPRAAFYLGNMHRDKFLEGGNDEDRETAVDWYVKRAGIEGWGEEIFMSILRTAELYAKDRHQKAMKIFMEAAGYRPMRPEPWFEMARLCNQHGEHMAALAFSEKGLGLPRCEDWLLVSRWMERWGLYFEGAVAAWHLGDKENAYAAFEKCLARPDLLPEYHDAAVRNLAIRDAELKPAPTKRTNANRSKSKKPRR